MLRSDNSIIGFVMNFFIHSDAYVKLSDYADIISGDNIRTDNVR